MKPNNAGKTSDNRAMWSTFAQAIDADLRPDRVIRGISGLDHEVQAIAVDDKSRRVIIVSAEANPRIAALMQADVQASMPGTHVLIARPIAVDLVQIARKIIEPLGLAQIDFAVARDKLAALQTTNDAPSRIVVAPETESAFANIMGVINTIELPAMSQILGLIAQADQLPWSDIGKFFGETAASGSLDFRALLATDNLAADLAVGVCPIPLYEFDGADLDLFFGKADLEAVRARLKTLDIYQYFFPSPDQLALSLVDHGLHDIGRIASTADSSPELGHPFGTPELLATNAGMVETIEQLKDLGYVAEGEVGIEISEQGRTLRSTIKYRPRESLVTKLLNRISVDLSPFDLIK